MSLERSWHERQLLEDLQQEIARGNVELIEDSLPFFERLLAAFPFDSGRLTWETVPGRLHLVAPPERAGESFQLSEPATELRTFWARVRHESRIDDDMAVLVLGDTLVSFVLKMSVRSLTGHLVDVLSLPQNTYIFPEDLSWCFNYTVQDDAFFGSRQ